VKELLEDLTLRQEEASLFINLAPVAGNGAFRGPQNSVTRLEKIKCPYGLQGKQQVLFQNSASAVRGPVTIAMV